MARIECDGFVFLVPLVALVQLVSLVPLVAVGAFGFLSLYCSVFSSQDLYPILCALIDRDVFSTN